MSVAKERRAGGRAMGKMWQRDIVSRSHAVYSSYDVQRQQELRQVALQIRGEKWEAKQEKIQ
eukprot:10599413-Prorocentrum_lima.AAC.1